MSRDQMQSTIVGELMDRFPATVRVFHRRRMACPGCAVARFMTVAETARCYGVAADVLAGELRRAIGGPTFNRRTR